MSQIKKIIIILTILSLTFSLNAKDKVETSLRPVSTNIPAKVKSALTKLYPNAKEIKLDKEGKNYEAGFINNGTKTSVDLDNNGNVLATETEIKISELPKGVEEFINKNYKEYTITETAKIVSSNGKTTYEAEITKGKKRKDLIFDKDGSLIKK